MRIAGGAGAADAKRLADVLLPLPLEPQQAAWGDLELRAHPIAQHRLGLPGGALALVRVAVGEDDVAPQGLRGLELRVEGADPAEDLPLRGDRDEEEGIGAEPLHAALEVEGRRQGRDAAHEVARQAVLAEIRVVDLDREPREELVTYRRLEGDIAGIEIGGDALDEREGGLAVGDQLVAGSRLARG